MVAGSFSTYWDSLYIRVFSPYAVRAHGAADFEPVIFLAVGEAVLFSTPWSLCVVQEEPANEVRSRIQMAERIHVFIVGYLKLRGEVIRQIIQSLAFIWRHVRIAHGDAADGIVGGKFHEGIPAHGIVAQHNGFTIIPAFADPAPMGSAQEWNIILLCQFPATFLSKDVIFIVGQFCGGK